MKTLLMAIATMFIATSTFADGGIDNATRMAYTDCKNHFRPDWAAGINRPLASGRLGTGLLDGILDLAVSAQAVIQVPMAIVMLPARDAERRQWNQPVTLVGVVVDETGHELSDAHLLIAYDHSVPSTFGFDYDYRSAFFTVGPHFNVQVSGHIYSITVSRDGYYTRIYQTAGADAVSLTDEAGHGVEGSPKLPYKALHIVLRKHGPLTILQRRLDTLWVDGKGAGEVIAPNLPATDWNSVRWVPNVERATAGFLYLTTSRDAGGIPSVTAMHYQDMQVVNPAEVRIGVAGAGNGIVIYNPSSGDDIWYEMRQAPATGYQSEVTLDAAAMQRFANNQKVWFYIKVGDRYGRGSLSDWDVSEFANRKYSRYGTRMVLEMQPDGTNNLETSP